MKLRGLKMKADTKMKSDEKMEDGSQDEARDYKQDAMKKHRCDEGSPNTGTSK
jgi:hypothetical protein